MNHSPSVTKCEVDFSSLLSLMRCEEREEGMTTEELAKLWDCSKSKALKILKDAKKQGLVRPTRVKIEDACGRDTSTYGYVVEVRQ